MTPHPPSKRITCKPRHPLLSPSHYSTSSLPTAKISNPDVTRLINSTEIQSVVRPANAKIQKRPWTQKKNPLVNKAILFRLNPYAKVLRRQELRTCPPLASLGPHSFPMPSSPTAKREKGKEVGISCWRGVPHYPLCSLKSFLRHRSACFSSYGPHALCEPMSCPRNACGRFDMYARDCKNNIWYQTVRRLIIRTWTRVSSMAFANIHKKTIVRYHVTASCLGGNPILFRESKLSFGQVVKRVLFLVKLADGEPKNDPSDTRQGGDGRIVPHEQRIGGQRCSGAKRSATGYPHKRGMHDDSQTKASPSAAESEFVKRNKDITSERMFLGALVNAYSSPVMEAKISLNAMNTYLHRPSREFYRRQGFRTSLLTIRTGSRRSGVRRVDFLPSLRKYLRNRRTGSSNRTFSTRLNPRTKRLAL